MSAVTKEFETPITIYQPNTATPLFDGTIATLSRILVQAADIFCFECGCKKPCGCPPKL